MQGSQLIKLKVHELKALLKQKGLPTSGVKSVLIKRLTDLSIAIVKSSTPAAQLSTPNLPVYHQTVSDLVELIPEFDYHYYENDIWMNKTLVPKTIKRIFKDIENLRDVCSSLTDARVKIFASEESLLLWKFIIVPPSDTGYFGGMFEFHMILPYDYPNAPPKVILMTTCGGTIRFNPNLYANGKVCLSLLGTWAGPGWNPDLSNLSEVILAILGQILGVEDPLANEPGITFLSKEKLNYAGYLRLMTLYAAMIQSVEQTTHSPEFYPFIRNYFMSNYATKIRPDLVKWSKKTVPKILGYSIANQITNWQYWTAVIEKNQYKTEMEKYIARMDRIVYCMFKVMGLVH
jgi:ubiquitin-protein ligase